jgi:hypothetical protein
MFEYTTAAINNDWTTLAPQYVTEITNLLAANVTENVTAMSDNITETMTTVGLDVTEVILDTTAVPITAMDNLWYYYTISDVNVTGYSNITENTTQEPVIRMYTVSSALIIYLLKSIFLDRFTFILFLIKILFYTF